MSGRPLPFCGHASLAASVVLQTLYPSLDKFSFAYPKVKAQPDGTKVSVDEILAVAKAEDGRICIDAIASIAPKSLTEPETEIVKIELREGAGIEASDILYLGKSLAVSFFDSFKSEGIRTYLCRFWSIRKTWSSLISSSSCLQPLIWQG